MDRNFGVVVAAVVGFFGLLLLALLPHSDRESFVARVEKTERVEVGTGDSRHSKYLVFTDHGVYENTDSLIEGKWNSSDVYGRMKPSECYLFDTYGWRVQLMSWYPNIVDATLVECDE